MAVLDITKATLKVVMKTSKNVCSSHTSILTALAGKARRSIGVIPRNKALGPSLRI